MTGKARRSKTLTVRWSTDAVATALERVSTWWRRYAGMDGAGEVVHMADGKPLVLLDVAALVDATRAVLGHDCDADRFRAERDADRADLRIRRNALADVLGLPHSDEPRGGDFYDLVHRVETLTQEVERWRSGRIRKPWPSVTAAPDGITYAARLARAQGTEGGEEHDRLLRDASMRMKALHDLAGPLLAERDALSLMLRKAARKVVEEREERKFASGHVGKWRALVDDLIRESRALRARLAARSRTESPNQHGINNPEEG